MKDHVLVIDDDFNTIELIKKVFTHKDYDLDIVYNDKDGLMQVVNNNYAYYFINLSLNGLYLIDLIKNIKSNPRIVVIASNIQFETEKKIRSRGITYLLVKPFEIKEIKDLILDVKGKNV
ncbi:MAG: response regulator [bacterium]|nr:response regulator [bacterium]